MTLGLISIPIHKMSRPRKPIPQSDLLEQGGEFKYLGIYKIFSEKKCEFSQLARFNTLISKELISLENDYRNLATFPLSTVLLPSCTYHLVCLTRIWYSYDFLVYQPLLGKFGE